MRPLLKKPAGCRTASGSTAPPALQPGTSFPLHARLLVSRARNGIRTNQANYNGVPFTVTSEPIISTTASTSDEEDYYPASSLGRHGRSRSPDPDSVDTVSQSAASQAASSKSPIWREVAGRSKRVIPPPPQPTANQEARAQLLQDITAPAPPRPGSNSGPAIAGADPWTAPGAATLHPATPQPVPGPTPALGTPGPAPAAASAESIAFASVDISDYPSNFPARRLLCFIGITAGYMGLYFTRGSLTYCAPVLLADPSLGMSITDLGVMTSAFPLAYGFSKFAGGVLGAKFSNRLMLGGGLLATAIINLVFGMSASVTVFTALWFLNGSLQGIGAPASASLLTKWFGSKERGTYWGLWNIGANLGGFLTPLVVGWVANHYGWRWGMWVPGAIGLSVALFVLAAVRDSPLAAGYTPHSASASAVPQAALPASATKPSKKSNMRAALEDVVKNRGVWLLALSYFFVYIVRQGATSWMMMYLMQTKGAANAAQAAFTVSGLEVGGLVGGTIAGILSDSWLKKAAAKEKEQGISSGLVGQRVRIVMAYIVCMLGALVALRFVPAGAQALQWLTIAALGFTIYGPHMLIGLCGAELVTKSAVGASQGVLGLVAYMGAANAGIPLSYVLKHHSWDGYFMVMAAACVCALGLLAPLANAKSFSQIQRAQRAQKLA